ncbi:DUF202 domain-containing protein [Gordonia sp. OPL2]|uniref:DUF202 domain-containing protein n=1 Tax=Gordonia sp. OPL2 TaxID=2486274 RepID=UPI00165632D6|nr:DUF202 domain-containing protein [Gordonia sp. OPL2]RPA12463.1 DUF202 domain-containing protein [Gordonia sp. OPL2]
MTSSTADARRRRAGIARPDGPPDDGLQLERTSMSLVRMVLSLLGCCTLCMRVFPLHSRVAVAGAIVASTVVTIAGVRETLSRPTRRRQFIAGRLTPALGTAAALAASIVLLALSGLWVVLA